LVSLDVSQGVVDVLEHVQVDEQHGQASLAIARLFEGDVQAIMQQHAVG
jgi:hypothetical protein